MNKYVRSDLAFAESLSVELDEFGRARGVGCLRDLLASIEFAIIAATLRATQGNQRRAARALGMLPTTLQEKLKRYGLRPRSDGYGVDAPPSFHHGSHFSNKTMEDA